MFKPLKSRESASDACANAIRRAILSGELAPGARLPPERTLAETFGVNRLTLRAALAQLAVVGLVKARQGSGYRVQDYERSGGPDLLPGIVGLAHERGALNEVIGDLLAVRRALARAVFDKLAERADTGACAEIEAAIAAFARAAFVGADLEAIAAADVEVAAALLRATGSDVLGLCLNPLTRVVSELQVLREAMYRDPASNVAGYQVLQAWLSERRADRIDDLIALLEQRDRETLRQLIQHRGDA